MNDGSRCACVALMAVLVGVPAAGAQPSFRFTGIGDLSGGSFSSGAYGISPDGAYVLGTSDVDGEGSVAVLWTFSGGLVEMGRLTNDGTPSIAYACSDDATVITGESNQRAFRWTKEDGMKDLGTLAPDNAGFATATDITRDGDIIVGTAQAKNGSDAFRWRAGEGLKSDGFSGATTISGDGRAFTAIQSNGGGQDAYLVRDGRAPVPLGDLPGGLVFTQPTAMTNDASVIVGASRSRRVGGGPSSGVNEAFVWREETGIVGLGNFEQTGFSSSSALAVSEDGSIIVGFGTRAFQQEAAIWFGDGQIVRLKSYLLSLGIDEVSAWTLFSANAISADGRTIAGTGLNPQGLPEGWVVHIPSPGAAMTLGIGAVMLRSRRRR